MHVFKLAEGAGEAGAGEAREEAAGEGGDGEAQPGWMEWLSRGLAAGAGYLPQHVADVLTQGRAFAAARLPVTGHRARAAITR